MDTSNGSAPQHPPYIAALLEKYPDARAELTAALEADKHLRSLAPAERRTLLIQFIRRIIAASDARVEQAVAAMDASDGQDPVVAMNLICQQSQHKGVCQTVQGVLAYLDVFWPVEPEPEPDHGQPASEA